jgi:hypothetical protein
MRRFAVAIPAAHASPGFVILAGYFIHANHIYQVLMTSYAVLLNHINARLLDSDNLWLCPGSKYGSMSHAIHGLEIILSENVVLRHMAVVAGGNLAVTAVIP